MRHSGESRNPVIQYVLDAGSVIPDLIRDRHDESELFTGRHSSVFDIQYKLILGYQEYLYTKPIWFRASPV
jgi:hypothetical protein